MNPLQHLHTFRNFFTEYISPSLRSALFLLLWSTPTRDKPQLIIDCTFLSQATTLLKTASLQHRTSKQSGIKDTQFYIFVNTCIYVCTQSRIVKRNIMKDFRVWRMLFCTNIPLQLWQTTCSQLIRQSWPHINQRQQFCFNFRSCLQKLSSVYFLQTEKCNAEKQ